MNALFYIAATVAVVATLLAISRRNPVHSLLYMITSLLAGSMIFFVLGAPYVAALQTIVYAGAIMVLFVFVIMMLNQGPASVKQETAWLSAKSWVGPGILSAVLFAETIYIVRGDGTWLPGDRVVEPREVSVALFTSYTLIVELASMLLLGGLISAFHIGRREPVHREEHR